uniref:Uncharacterized protein n=1 Tax=Anguilla anguilla TaxID=7936 RepID=A0A0E9SML2_ANGAN
MWSKQGTFGLRARHAKKTIQDTQQGLATNHTTIKICFLKQFHLKIKH